MRRVVLATLATLLLTAAPASAQATACTAAPAAEPAGGPDLRYGVAPSAEPRPGHAPDRIDATLAKLELLLPPRGPFVAQVHTSWRDAGPGEDARLARLAAAYASIGADVEYVLRYRPPAGREGDVAGYVEWVRHVVATRGPSARTAGFQVTDEANVAAGPGSPDGAYAGARDALVDGVLAAREQARAIGRGEVAIGFDWAYRASAEGERAFFAALRARGGERFAGAVSYVGLDFHPGTYHPLSGDERAAAVAALGLLRGCLMPAAGIADAVPIHVSETGYPTGAGRTWSRQAQAAEAIVRAFHDFRGTFNVTDLRWYSLRDAHTGSPSFDDQHGLLGDDYDPKPAFERYRSLVRELSRREPTHPAVEARPRLRIVGARRGCARGTLLVELSGAAGAGRVELALGGRRLGVDREPPFRRRLSLRRARPGVRRLSAVVHYAGGGRARVAGPRVRVCARR